MNKWMIVIGVILGLAAVGLMNFYVTRVEDAQVSRSFVKLKPEESLTQGKAISVDQLEVIQVPEDFGPLSDVVVEFTPELEAWFNEQEVVALRCEDLPGALQVDTYLRNTLLDRHVERAQRMLANQCVPVSYTHLRAHET